MAKKRKYSLVPETPHCSPLPTTVAEAVAFLQARTAPDIIAEIKGTPFNDLNPGDPFAPNSICWLLSTCPNARIRDGKKAIQHGRKAVEITPKQWRTTVC